MKTLIVALVICLGTALKAEPAYRYLALRLDAGYTKQLASLERKKSPEISLTKITFGRAISVLSPIHDDKDDYFIYAGILDPTDKIASKIIIFKGVDISIAEVYDRLCVQVGAVWMFNGDTIVIKPSENEK
jgi:hypothetical protein